MIRDLAPFVPSEAEGRATRGPLGARASTSSTPTVLGLLAATLLLAACGKVQDLQPAAGKALPPKPATAPAQPQPDTLLAVPTQSRPGRSDELLNRSSIRPDDKFDLPPRR